MKKVNFLLTLILSVALTSCDNPNLQSGGWIIPVGLIGGFLYSLYRYFVKKSAGALGFAIGLLITTCVVLYLMLGDR